MGSYLPHKLREAAVQALFALDMGAEEELLFELIQEHARCESALVQQIKQHVKNIWQSREQLDRYMMDYSKEFSFERISVMEKAILRLAFYEILWDKLEVRVVISEAIRLARKFSTDKAHLYLHGMIHSVYATYHPLPSTV